MNEQTLQADRRTKLGNAGVFGSALVLATAVLTIAAMQASFRTWKVGKYFDHADFFDVLVGCFLLAIMTFLAACFGRGGRRSLGILLSILTVTSVVFVLWKNP